jgi:hypothetical protein
MKHIFFLFLFIFSSILSAQEEMDPFDKYGAPGMVYTNLKDA